MADQESGILHGGGGLQSIRPWPRSLSAVEMARHVFTSISTDGTAKHEPALRPVEAGCRSGRQKLEAVTLGKMLEEEMEHAWSWNWNWKCTEEVETQPAQSFGKRDQASGSETEAWNSRSAVQPFSPSVLRHPCLVVRPEVSPDAARGYSKFRRPLRTLATKSADVLPCPKPRIIQTPCFA